MYKTLEYVKQQCITSETRVRRTIYTVCHLIWCVVSGMASSKARKCDRVGEGEGSAAVPQCRPPPIHWIPYFIRGHDGAWARLPPTTGGAACRHGWYVPLAQLQYCHFLMKHHSTLSVSNVVNNAKQISLKQNVSTYKTLFCFVWMTSALWCVGQRD